MAIRLEFNLQGMLNSYIYPLAAAQSHLLFYRGQIAKAPCIWDLYYLGFPAHLVNLSALPEKCTNSPSPPSVRLIAVPLVR